MAIALVGPLEPVVRLGLLTAVDHRVELRHTDRSGEALIAEARRTGADAVLVRRDDLADLETLPQDLLALGLSSASFDVLVVRNGVLDHLWNPTPEQLMGLVLEAGRPHGG